MTEVRKATRVRTMLGGTIIFNNRASTIDCKIRNMSDAGAKLIVDGATAIPQLFEFAVPHKGRSFQCKVVWRHGEETGVEFVDADAHHRDGVSPDADLTKRLRDLEAENAKLKRRVIDLQSRIDRDMMSGA